MKRMVIITARDLTRMIQDYMFPEDAPRDMKPVKLMISPSNQGKLGLLVGSGEWDGYQGEQMVDYQVKKVYGV